MDNSCTGKGTSVRFKEVVVYFSEEEWNQLDPWQKELYSNVMRDIHAALLSLGYTILHPDVLCRVRRDQAPYISSQEEDCKDLCFSTTNASVLSPDTIFKINHGEETCEGNPPNSFTKCASILSPDIIFRIKHEGEDGESEFPDEMSEAPNNKEETPDGDQKEDQKCSHRHEDLTSETSEGGRHSSSQSAAKKRKLPPALAAEPADQAKAADQLVFNPKFSIWIKQVDAVSQATPEVGSATCTDGNVTKIKTEIDLTPDCNKSLPAQNLPEATSDKTTIAKIHEAPEPNLPLHRDEHAGSGEESLLSIVLRGADAESLYIPTYKHASNCKDPDYSRGLPGMAEKAVCYQPPRSFFRAPNSNDLLSSFCSPPALPQDCAHPAPPQHCAHPAPPQHCAHPAPPQHCAHPAPPQHCAHPAPPQHCAHPAPPQHYAHPAPPQHYAHQMDRPYRCRTCDKAFKTLGILNVHMKTHSGVRPYQCGECGKSFRDNWNLKVHQKIHTGETPYRCAVCDKGFIQYATYMKHRRIHTGEKPYTCCYCDKSFTNSSNLVRHYRTHTGEKPYACKECGKCFSYNTSLIQHKRVHKGEPAGSGTNGPSNK